MKIFGKLTLIALSILSLSACEKNGKWHCTHGNGIIAQEERFTQPYTGIELRMDADVYLLDGSEPGLIIKTSQNLFQLIETRIEGNRLVITEKNDECIWSSDDIQIFASMTTINHISILGHGDVINTTPLRSEDLYISIDGNGDVVLNDINPDSYSIYIDGSGDVRLASLDTANFGSIGIRGSGDVNTTGVPTNHVDIDISGSGNVDVHALKSLDVKINGSGDVGYYGNPSITTDISGSGNVIRK